jgi:hypothetical protein
VEAFHQLGAMIFDRFGTDFKKQRDPFGGFAFGNQLKYLALGVMAY